MAAMRGHRRVLLIATPGPQDPKAMAQRRILSGWKKGAANRDLSLVEVSGERATGAADDAVALSQRYRLKPGVFQVVLIGKDGNVALRSAHPATADTLQGTISTPATPASASVPSTSRAIFAAISAAS
jgi:hypothetical protein